MKTTGSSVVVSPLKIILISDSVNDGQFDGTIRVRPLDITFLDNDPRSIIRETRFRNTLVPLSKHTFAHTLILFPYFQFHQKSFGFPQIEQLNLVVRLH